MPTILSKTDFKGGKFDIPSTGTLYANTDIDEFIERYENEYLYRLFGVTFGKAIKIYATTTPTPPPNTDYDSVIQPFAEDNDCEIRESKGLKEYLKACVFYEYTYSSLVTSLPGVVQPKAEAGQIQGSNYTARYAESRYNEILDTADAIQARCQENQTLKTDYNGQKLRVKASNIF